MTVWADRIRAEAAKLIRRHETYLRSLADEQKRRARRTTAIPVALEQHRPKYWEIADGFNPYLVRARADRIAHALESALRLHRYSPCNPLIFPVPKLGGGRRDVSVYQIADAVVSKVVFDRLMEKNRPLISARAYAYRDDVTVHDAIRYIDEDLRGVPRLFVAEYDFSKFFDTISHEHIHRTLRDHQFFVTDTEDRIIRAFLSSPGCQANSYRPRGGNPRTVGVPQGTSVSLFLANIAAWELDRAMERLGVSFVRYADDTVIWSRDYSQICRAVDAIFEMSAKIGCSINLKKSKGIRLLTREESPSEIQNATTIEFLGHSLSLKTTSIKPSFVEKIKLRINQLIYFNLVREPMRGRQSPSRIGKIDKDYVTYVWQLRRYLYGDINERGLRCMLTRGAPPRRFLGVMSFFPLIADIDLLQSLDRWLLCQTHMALRKRAKLLLASGLTSQPWPLGVSCLDLRKLVRKSSTTGGVLDLRLPSFARVHKAIEQAVRQHGSSVVARKIRYEY